MAPKQDYYSYAFDSESRLIHIDDAIKGKEYRCPNCGRKMIPKQGEKRVWHFAHEKNTENCSYETYLHKIAKRRICECFNESEKFTIRFNPKVRCAVAECPLGAKQPCEWTNKLRTYDLKKYYSKCEEEKFIDNFKADLLVDGCMNGSTKPILIEIWVTHRSTDEKLKSGLRIIEIHIELEEDIDQIVKTASIIETQCRKDRWGNKIKDDRINFYNFKTDKNPDHVHQSTKHLFWIDSKGMFNCDSYSMRCLENNPHEIEKSIFRIESRKQIDMNFAFSKLAESGLDIKFCPMCEWYNENQPLMKQMCTLFTKGPAPFSKHTNEEKFCPHFKQKDYTKEVRLFEHECKITIVK